MKKEDYRRNCPPIFPRTKNIPSPYALTTDTEKAPETEACCFLSGYLVCAKFVMTRGLSFGPLIEKA